jgi:hypothetical protein
MVDRASEVNANTAHSWDGDVFCATLVKNANGRTTYHTKKFDFRALGVARVGFLVDVLEKLPTPALASQAYIFHKLVTDMCNSHDNIKLLSTPTGQLRERDIVKLMLGAERAILAYSDRKAPRSAFYNGWTPFRTSGLTLGDGVVLENVQFDSTLPVERPTDKALISDTYDANIAEPEIAEPVTTPGNGEQKAGDRIANHLNKRINFIIDAFKSYLLKCFHLRDLIITTKEFGFPDFVSPKQKFAILHYSSLGDTYSRYSAEQRFHIYCYRLGYRTQAQRVREQEVVIHDFQPLADVNVSGPRGAHTWMLSDMYLTWEAILSIVVILQIDTCWNNGAILSLERNQVVNTEHGYVLYGAKSKTGDLLDPHEIKTSREYDTLPYQERLQKFPERFCVELLLKNLESINSIPGVKETRLFLRPTTHTQNEVFFRIVAVNWNIGKLCDAVGVARFTLKQLRDQAANRIYFRDGKNIHHLMVILKHKNLDATAQYLNTGIVALECEAISNEFTKVFEQAILFISGRDMAPELSDELRTKAVTLFPLSDFSDEPEACLISFWLKSNGKAKIYIDEDAVAMCSSQKYYYANHSAELAARDPERFRDSHLPLIVACTALHRIIAASHFGPLLSEYDKRFRNEYA